jgi:hypothetical protein
MNCSGCGGALSNVTAVAQKNTMKVITATASRTHFKMLLTRFSLDGRSLRDVAHMPVGLSVVRLNGESFCSRRFVAI